MTGGIFLANGENVISITDIPELTFDYDPELDSELIKAFHDGFSLTLHVSDETYATLKDVLDLDAAERMLDKIKQAVKEYVREVNSSKNERSNLCG